MNVKRSHLQPGIPDDDVQVKTHHQGFSRPFSTTPEYNSASSSRRLAQWAESTCGEVEDVVSVRTPDCRGVAQVFHDLLVELRLLLVVEVESEEKEDGQEEGEEVKGGSQVEEKTTTWMTMVME